MLNNLPVGVLIQKSHELRFVSSTASKLLTGKENAELADVKTIVDHNDALKAAIENNTIETVGSSCDVVVNQIDYVDSEGKIKPLGMNTIVLGLQDEPHSVCMLQDQSLYRELEKANIAKQYLKTFFAMTTHEFRNPLHGVLGIFEALLESVQGAEQATQCRMGINTVKLMMRLVNDILDLSQIEANNFRLANEEIDIGGLVRECMELMQYKYKAKGVALVFQPLGGKLPEIKCDKNRYMQILLNLLGNAIKFTERGSVTIKLAYEPLTKKLVTEVTDTGIGIKEEDQLRLFKAFGKLEDTLQQNPQGTGLGLYICKRIAEAMGGSIQISSEYLKGSSITFSIQNQATGSSVADLSEDRTGSEHDDSTRPLARYCEIIEAGYHFSKASAAASNNKPPPILVVDDELMCATAVKAYLKHAGLAADIV